ncbi:acyl-CoA:lysophosphatidylglycerol acyltransferase 1-like isoform X2 [Harmonia axyridis]|uniref:acyl-CoA:lysophosphatidylglycerol acyltransferase 1-like isoform X2 n=1 Tax=Harmonia axyridis TaxID=115357 RepID=UPI001E275027|nr:acyl-CoA:lysophosphatidylglycerol acyltransferase 1-like isoform X2 [Harmonia axyridis]
MSILLTLFLIPKGIFRLCFILLNNVYCIGTYTIWMIMLYPLRRLGYQDMYYKIEGKMFHWMLAMVAMWSWWAGYEVMEAGDDITECLEDRTLVIANHQSTGDVPLLMATFNTRRQILPNIMWIMDSVFKYTNFGIVSVIHQDFFIMSGRKLRERSLLNLASHIYKKYIPLKRKWLILFPEGGFLRKRKVGSQKYALKNNLPHLEHVTVPRVGALHTIMDCLNPEKVAANNNSTIGTEITLLIDETSVQKLEWILDITIAYPKGNPIDLAEIVFGYRPPCKTLMVYKLYPLSQVPKDPDSLSKWLLNRWVEKERMLETYYQTGEFPLDENSQLPTPVVQDPLRFLILHLIFIASTYFHVQVFAAAYHYCSYLIY